MLTRQQIAEVDPGPFGCDLSIVATTGSTNDDLLSEAKLGAPHGRTLFAETQTKGKGRLGRSWYSPEGENLYFSVLLRPSSSRLDLFPPLALVAGVAIAEALKKTTGVNAQLKWPNDVLIEGMKVSGILAEATDVPRPALVIGIGININQQTFPNELENIATSLSIEKKETIDRALIAGAVLRELSERFSQAENGHLEKILDDWTRLSSTIGKSVRCPDSIVGTATGVDKSGALVVRDQSGKSHLIISGPIEEISGPLTKNSP